MGRYNFTATRVHRQATRLLETSRTKTKPAWYDTIGTYPPSQILVRPQPVQHEELRAKQKKKSKKPSKMFKPLQISYREDRLRKTFYADHPWELARPRVVLENDGRDGERADWSHIQSLNSPNPLNGESVVQRQMWLLDNVADMTEARAYDQARHEFYGFRYQEDVERRVAREEAESTGAYFGKTYLEVGMELEDHAYEEWKSWALKELTEAQQRRASATPGADNEESALDANDPETEAGLDDMRNSVPAQGQEALGGSPAHP